MIVSVVSKTVISMMMIFRMMESQKPSKTLNWRHFSSETNIEEWYRIQQIRLNQELHKKQPQYEQSDEKNGSTEL